MRLTLLGSGFHGRGEDLQTDLDLPAVRHKGGQNRIVLGPHGSKSSPR